MEIEFVGLHHYSQSTGIGRYICAIQQHLQEHLPISTRALRRVPGASRFTALQHLPIGIRRHRPGAIVHFPQIMGCAMMLWRPYHPSVATVYDLGVLELPEEWKMFDPIARQILRLSLAGLKHVDRIVAVSEFTRRSIIHHLQIPPERVVTVYPGLEHARYRYIGRAQTQLLQRYPMLATAGRPWLLYVGSELPRKNLSTLFSAVTRLKHHFPDLHLLKVGSAGGKRFRQSSLAQVAGLGLERSIVFFDEVPEADLPLFYNAADVFVQPSKLEGFGFPVLEAMACGTPVVCSNAGSLPEVAGDAATIVDIKNPENFFDSLLALLSNPIERERRRAEGIKRSQRFDWSNTAAALLDQYHLVTLE